MKLFFKLALPLLFLTLAVGCRSFDNNYLEPNDFARYLEKEGVPVDAPPRAIMTEPFAASAAAAISIDGGEIGVYKYDRNSRIQSERLERIIERNALFVQGVPFPIEVRGSFVFFGLEKHPRKRQILQAVDKFY